MSRSLSFPSRLWNLATASLVAIALASSPAVAGLGDLVKKAKEKVTQAGSPKPTATEAANAKVVFDEVTLELTPERLDHILATFKAAEAASAGRPELVQKLQKATDENDKIEQKDGEKMRDLQRKRGDIDICYHDAYMAASERRTKEYAANATTDPAILARYAELAKQNSAEGVSDSVKLARLNDAAMDFLRPTKEDSAAARKQCGPVPPKMASEIRTEELQKQIASLNEEIRKIDEKVSKAQSKQGGLNQQQWGMALERIQMYLGAKRNASANGGKSNSDSKSSDKSKSDSKESDTDSDLGSSATVTVPGFTRVEVEALEKRLEKFRTIFG